MYPELHKCSCGRIPALRKQKYESKETCKVEEFEHITINGEEVLVTVIRERTIPKIKTAHFVQCPGYHCGKRTECFGTKTKAIKNWNELFCRKKRKKVNFTRWKD